MITWHSRSLQWILRVFYRLLYHRLAWTYDLVAGTVSVGLWQEWVRAVVPFIEGPRVLELGHGPGYLQKDLSAMGPPISLVVGLDRSQQMGFMARKRLIRLKFCPNLVNGESQSLPFQDQSFDQIVATFPTEYIADPRTLSEIQRVLIQRGSLIVLPVAYITGKRLRERLAAWLFNATGQSPEWDDRVLSSAWHSGFEIKIERLTLEASSLVIIVARKSE
jgi:ubiquinone/menaquinone biosynthesis C-methylase UbiE